MALPFQTPPNQKSFSGLIDAAILATGKPGSLVSAVQYANMTIRECQAFGLFAADLVEDVIYPTQDNYVWTRPAYFRIARSFKYLTCCEYPRLKLPGRAQRNICHYYYAADDYFVFHGVSSTEQIASAIYYWSPPLSYYQTPGVNGLIYPGQPYATRPAYFDVILMQWFYLQSDGFTYLITPIDPTQASAIRKAAMNWLVQDWYDLILAGTKAKVWNQAGDPRSANEYSLYKQLQTLMKTTTSYESEAF